VILLHGLLGSADNWHSVATLLSDRYRVVVPDLRNHGRSPHSAQFSYSDLAGDVLALIQEMNLDRPTVVGHSMGGKAAMELALSRPDVPGLLIVEDMVPGETLPISGRYITLLRDMDLTKIGRRKDAEETLLEHVPERALVLFLLKNLVRASDTSFEWRANLEGLEEHYDRLWEPLRAGREWRGPTLFIRGGLSDIVGDEAFGEVFSFFPNARIATIEQAGHWVHGDALTEFMIHVLNFLDTADSQK
jgi:esterase